MRTKRNLWAIPPGDDGTVRKALRRQRRRKLIANGAAFMVVIASFTYPLMNESTAVTTEDLVAQFRAEKSGAAASDDASSDSGSPKAKGRASSPDTKEAAKGSKSSASPSRSRTTAAASPKAESRSVGSGGGGQRSHASAAAPEDEDSRPEEGVYTWSVEGYEQAPGVNRDLPREANRVLTHSSDEGRWVEHMVFSQQKEMWFDITAADGGVVTNSSRNKVTIGPVTQDKTVVFDPPMLVSNWPFKVGETWDGSWDGKSYGTYRGKTIEHTFIEIEGERVEVFASEVRMQMKGDIEGAVLTRSWVSPKYNMVVRQYMETDVQSGPGNYYSEWMGTVQSLTPQT